MSEIRTSIVLDLQGNLERRAAQASRALERFGSRGVKALRRMAPEMKTVRRKLDRLGNRYTALLTGAAGLGTFRGLTQLQDQMVRLGIQAGKSDAEIAKLKDSIFSTARAPEIRVDPAQIIAAVNEIVEKTGDLDFAEQNIRNIGLAIQATGAEGGAIGGILAEFQKMGVTAPRQVLEAIDLLNVQGKQGAFTLQNLATLGPRVVTAYTSMGREGVPALREMGAALQMIRMGTGSSEQAATAFEALLRTLGDAQKLELLKKSGIQVFDVEAAKEGKEVLRPITDIMIELVDVTRGRKELLSTVFDAEAIRAFNQAVGEYKRTGAVAGFQRFMEVQSDGTTTVNDSARAAGTASAALQNLYTSWQKFADDKLTKHLETLTGWLDSLSTEQVDKWIGRITAMGGALLGLSVASKAVITAGGLAKLGGLLGLGKVAAAGGGALATAGSAALPALAGVASAGALGYGAGSMLNAGIDAFDESWGTRIGESIGEAVARALSLFGNEEARLAIEINTAAGAKARIIDKRGSGFDVDMDGGPSMVMP